MISKSLARLAALVCVLGGPGMPGLATAVEVDLDLSQFSAVWTFDDSSNRLLDLSGTHTLSVVSGSNSYIAAPASANGWQPFAVFQQPANPFSPPAYLGNPGPVGSVWSQVGSSNKGLQLPGGVYSGGSWTTAFGVRRAGSSDLSFGTLLSSQRFQMHVTSGGTSINFRTTGGAGNSGLNGAPISMNADDWNLIIVRYNANTNAVNTYSLTNTATLPVPQTGTATGTGFEGALDFRLGLDGLTLIGGSDALNGYFDFFLFHDGFLSDSTLQDLANYFQDGPPPPLAPEPGTMILFATCMVGLAGWLWRRRRP